MIEPDQLTRAAYAIFQTSMNQQLVPGPHSNQSLAEFWTYEWEANADNYRAQARAAFAAAGLEVSVGSEPGGRRS